MSEYDDGYQEGCPFCVLLTGLAMVGVMLFGAMKFARWMEWLQ